MGLSGTPAEAFDIGMAAPRYSAAVLALLPELCGASVLPETFVVAHQPGHPWQLFGAAAFVPVIHHARWPGYRCMVRVLPAYRRRGIGRSLIGRLVDEARAWDVAHLHAWTDEPEGPASTFLRSCSFRIGHTLHDFVGETASTLPLCRRLVEAMRAHGRIPAAFALHPLEEVPLEAVALLHCCEFGGLPEQAAELIKAVLLDVHARQLSLALWDGVRLAGCLLAGRGQELPEVRYWVTDPQFRQGWPAAVLLHAYVQALHDRGLTHARYHCNSQTLATLNIARKTGALLEGLRHGHVLDLNPP